MNVMKTIGLLLMSFAAAFAAAPDLEITLAHNSAPEAATREQLLKLLNQHDAADLIFTRRVVIDSGATPHSHPVLTLNTRYLKQDRQLLSTFVHEQYHWYEQAHKRQVDAAMAELRRAWRTLPVGSPEGAEDEDSTYLHVIVCFAEYQSLKRIFGEGEAHKLIDFWSRDHYRAIYRLLLDEEVNVGAIVRRHGLWPPQ